MAKNKLITVTPETKDQLDDLKVHHRETYNDVLERVLPAWASKLKSKLEEREGEPSPVQDEQDSSG